MKTPEQFATFCMNNPPKFSQNEPGRRPFKCMICRRKFKTKFKVTKHLDLVHDWIGVKYQCDDCHIDVDNIEDLVSHILQCHGSPSTNNKKSKSPFQSDATSTTNDIDLEIYFAEFHFDKTITIDLKIRNDQRDISVDDIINECINQFETAYPLKKLTSYNPFNYQLRIIEEDDMNDPNLSEHDLDSVLSRKSKISDLITSTLPNASLKMVMCCNDNGASSPKCAISAVDHHDDDVDSNDYDDDMEINQESPSNSSPRRSSRLANKKQSSKSSASPSKKEKERTSAPRRKKSKRKHSESDSYSGSDSLSRSESSRSRSRSRSRSKNKKKSKRTGRKRDQSRYAMRYIIAPYSI